MNLKKIIIYQHDILFEILNEIKKKFGLDIIKADPQNFDTLKEKIKSDFLIITKFKQKNIDNQLIIENKPIKIEKLIELINIQFLREKFIFQSDISIGPYKLNLNSREITRDDKTIDLTEREINLILFLKKSPTAIKINELQKKVWSYSSELETHTVETHIYRLRKKIKEEFNDEKFIISSKEGYAIN